MYSKTINESLVSIGIHIPACLPSSRPHSLEIIGNIGIWISDITKHALKMLHFLPLHIVDPVWHLAFLRKGRWLRSFKKCWTSWNKRKHLFREEGTYTSVSCFPRALELALKPQICEGEWPLVALLHSPRPVPYLSKKLGLFTLRSSSAG